MQLSAGVVLDALGGFSPLSAQARGGQAPEAAMLLVGSCVEGGQQGSASSSSSADVLWGWTPLDRWESSCRVWQETIVFDGLQDSCASAAVIAQVPVVGTCIDQSLVCGLIMPCCTALLCYAALSVRLQHSVHKVHCE
jgi:hypothetical protein